MIVFQFVGDQRCICSIIRRQIVVLSEEMELPENGID